MAGIAIVAIPEQDDPVWKVSSEKVPHLTLLYLEGPLNNEENTIRFIQHAVKTSLHRFGLSVNRRGILGADNADVVFLDKRYGGKELLSFRGYLLTNTDILSAYQKAEQYPVWTPHVTLGFPTSPANKVDEKLYWINFDRIAVWTGDYVGPEFLLEEDRGMELDVPAEWSDDNFSDFLEHFGVRGMKWGVRREASTASGAYSRVSGGKAPTDAAKRAAYEKAGGDLAKANMQAFNGMRNRSMRPQGPAMKLARSPKYSGSTISQLGPKQRVQLKKEFDKEIVPIVQKELDVSTPKGYSSKLTINDFGRFEVTTVKNDSLEQAATGTLVLTAIRDENDITIKDFEIEWDLEHGIGDLVKKVTGGASSTKKKYVRDATGKFAEVAGNLSTLDKLDLATEKFIEGLDIPEAIKKTLLRGLYAPGDMTILQKRELENIRGQVASGSAAREIDASSGNFNPKSKLDTDQVTSKGTKRPRITLDDFKSKKAPTDKEIEDIFKGKRKLKQSEFSSPDDVLMHFGVRGMKWGVRRSVGPDGRVLGKPPGLAKKSGGKSDTDDDLTPIKIKRGKGSADHQRMKKNLDKKVEDLSTADIKALTARLKAVNELKATTAAEKAAKASLGKKLTRWALNQVVEGVNQQGGKYVKELVGETLLDVLPKTKTQTKKDTKERQAQEDREARIRKEEQAEADRADRMAAEAERKASATGQGATSATKYRDDAVNELVYEITKMPKKKED